MILYIDTSDNTKTVVELDNYRLKKATGIDKSQQLLNLINQILKEYGVSINQIRGIQVNTGPGSFTGLKVGVAVANTLGWTLKIPVNGRIIDKEDIVEPLYG